MASGSRIARCEDPQGAIFALMEQTKDKAVGYFARGGLPRARRPALVVVRPISFQA